MNSSANVSNQLSGGTAQNLVAYNGDTRFIRPWLDTRTGRSYISVPQYDNATRKTFLKDVPTMNAATLRKDDWKMVDSAVVQAARPRLRFFGDLIQAGLEVRIPNALGKMVWQYERQSSISDATVSMDGVKKGDSDRPTYDLDQMPLPIIHKDFTFGVRHLTASHSSNTPIDISAAASAGQACAEMVERLALGVAPEHKFGGGAVYGVCNHPDAIATTFTNPWTTAGTRNPDWTPGLMQREILALRQRLYEAHHYGPFNIYHSPDFDVILDDDFNVTTSGVSISLTMRERLLKIDSIKAVKTSEFLPPGTFCMVEMNQQTINAVSGLDISTVQWQTEAGFEVHFKVLCIMLPRIKTSYSRHTGIAVARLVKLSPYTP